VVCEVVSVFCVICGNEISASNRSFDVKNVCSDCLRDLEV
jgi:hypothetical protein